MKEYAAGIQSSELSLVDVPATPVDAAPDVDAVPDSAGPPAGADSERAPPAASGDGILARAAKERLSVAAIPATSRGAAPAAGPPAGAGSERAAAAGEDRFLARAAKEHAAGHVDAPLWARAMAQAGGDKARAKDIYLDSRATAIRVEKRQEEAARRARVVEALSDAPEPGSGARIADAPRAGDETTAAKQPRKTTGRSRARPNRLHLIAAAGTVACVAIVAGSIALWSESGPAQPRSAVKPLDLAKASSPPVAPGKMPAATTKPGEPPPEAGSGEDFVARTQELEKAGNWNLFVLYAVEWTRKQPQNPAAWKKLSLGYARLRQFTEAVDAATKATQIAPEDFALWQNLGQVNLAVPRPAEALTAFQKASALNDRDIVSLAQVGTLNTQLGHLREAEAAFAQALAMQPDDVPALCGSAALAFKQGRAKDADAIKQQATSVGGQCSDPTPSQSVRVADSAPAKSKPTSVSKR